MLLHAFQYLSSARPESSLLFGRVLRLSAWKRDVWVGHERGLGGSQRRVGNYCFFLIWIVGIPSRFISQNQKEALFFFIWCMHKLWNSLDGVKDKIINISKSILTHLWKKKRRPLRSTKLIDADVIFGSENSQPQIFGCWENTVGEGSLYICSVFS